jgi:hypothetical protein
MRESINPRIPQAIDLAIRAGVFRRAARLNPSAEVWAKLADEQSGKVRALLSGLLA